MRTNGRGSSTSEAGQVLVQLDVSSIQNGLDRRHADCPEYFRYEADRQRIVRTIQNGSGRETESFVDAVLTGRDPQDADQATLGAAFDLAWLRSRRAPASADAGQAVRCVDLFSGLGGMSLGVAEAARALGRPFELVWAADIFDHARTTLATNHAPTRKPFRHPIERLLDGEIGQPLSPRERVLKRALGPIDVLVGGPPCQGHSDLNNHTRRNDPKNALMLRMVRAAEVLEPTHVIIENVPGVARDHSRVMESTIAQLEQIERLGYRTDAGVVKAERLGVAQTRHRMLVVASEGTTPSLEATVDRMEVPERPFEWACGDLGAVPGSGYDSTGVAAPATKKRIEWLFAEPGRFDLPNHLRPKCHQKPHRYVSVYGRMWPNRPAGTITTGFMVMGQGRFVHPNEPRTLTPHEGARLQFLPDWVVIPKRNRKDYGTLIGNAVPPKVSYAVTLGLLV